MLASYIINIICYEKLLKASQIVLLMPQKDRIK